eukprot:Seg333.2 transcript_id=Seg333.2/GoldUCD/mRNA.D3Y31 product="hypothetical protein" protein_id=Seg333.2/GoldUCD/D3Y31
MLAGDEEEAEAGAAAGMLHAPRSSFNLNLRPPDPVRLGKNSADSWKMWKQLWENYYVPMRVNTQPNVFQKSLLISVMGMEALQIYNASEPQEIDTVTDIIQKLDRHILGQTNEIFERFKFNSRSQKPDESIDSYVTCLKSLAKTCKFCDCLRDSLLRDRIVIGVMDDNLRKHLIQKRGLTLTECLDMCRSFESTRSQLQVISGKQEAINKIHKSSFKQSKQPESKAKRDNKQPEIIECTFCGQSHAKKKELCFAWGKHCNKCKGKNHFAKCCKSKRVHEVSQRDDSVRC